MNRADAVTKGRPVVAPRSLHGSMMNSEHYRIALLRREHFEPRLPARPLFGKDEFAAVEILSSPAQKESHLKRKHDFAVEILVQAVEITGAVFQQQRRWAFLTGAMTLLEKNRQLHAAAMASAEAQQSVTSEPIAVHGQEESLDVAA